MDIVCIVGGLGIIWNPQEVSLHNFVASDFTLSAKFYIIGTRISGLITNIYGPFALARKIEFLNSLDTMKAWVGDIHWILGGDFNLITSLQEKQGGT